MEIPGIHVPRAVAGGMRLVTNIFTPGAADSSCETSDAAPVTCSKLSKISSISLAAR